MEYAVNMCLSVKPAFHQNGYMDQIKSNMNLIMVDKLQRSYNLLNMMK